MSFDEKPHKNGCKDQTNNESLTDILEQSISTINKETSSCLHSIVINDDIFDVDVNEIHHTIKLDDYTENVVKRVTDDDSPPILYSDHQQKNFEEGIITSMPTIFNNNVSASVVPAPTMRMITSLQQSLEDEFGSVFNKTVNQNYITPVHPPAISPFVENSSHPLQYHLSPFQLHGCAVLRAKHNLLVTAHTGAGKTLLAHFLIAQCLASGERVVYTTPIKALGNDKYNELKKLYHNVGLITGDSIINPDADVVVVTTEVLRNNALNSEMLFHAVIYDEVHYMKDRERGIVWEESIITLGPRVQMLFLSATLKNDRDFAQWICQCTYRPCHIVATLFRPVPLVHLVVRKNGMRLIADSNGKYYEDAIDQIRGPVADTPKGKHPADRLRNSLNTVTTAISTSVREKWLPMIVFSFGRKQCDDYAYSITRHSTLYKETESVEQRKSFTDAQPYGEAVPHESKKDKQQRMFKLNLTSVQEKIEIESFLDEYLPPDHDVASLKRLLLLGVGLHHSGLVPRVREVVEVLLKRNLVKVLFTTESFAMGVNVPVKCVFFSELNKFDGSSRRALTSGEYTQMAGRAGRRGYDSMGICIFNDDDLLSKQDLKNMLLGGGEEIEGRLSLTYQLLLSTLSNRDGDATSVSTLSVEHIVDHSFGMFLFNKYKHINEVNLDVKSLSQPLTQLPSLNQFYKQSSLLSSFAPAPPLSTPRSPSSSMASYLETDLIKQHHSHSFSSSATAFPPLLLLPYLQPGRVVYVGAPLIPESDGQTLNHLLMAYQPNVVASKVGNHLKAMGSMSLVPNNPYYTQSSTLEYGWGVVVDVRRTHSENYGVYVLLSTSNMLKPRRKQSSPHASNRKPADDMNLLYDISSHHPHHRLGTHLSKSIESLSVSSSSGNDTYPHHETSRDINDFSVHMPYHPDFESQLSVLFISTAGIKQVSSVRLVLPPTLNLDNSQYVWHALRTAHLAHVNAQTNSLPNSLPNSLSNSLQSKSDQPNTNKGNVGSDGSDQTHEPVRESSTIAAIGAFPLIPQSKILTYIATPGHSDSPANQTESSKLDPLNIYNKYNQILRNINEQYHSLQHSVETRPHIGQSQVDIQVKLELLKRQIVQEAGSDTFALRVFSNLYYKEKLRLNQNASVLQNTLNLARNLNNDTVEPTSDTTSTESQSKTGKKDDTTQYTSSSVIIGGNKGDVRGMFLKVRDELMVTLKKTGLLNENLQLTHMGRIALPLNSIDCVVLSNLLLRNNISQLQHSHFAALLATFFDMEPLFADKNPLTCELNEARSILDSTLDYLLENANYKSVNKFAHGIMYPVHQWCTGSSFDDIISESKMFAGTFCRILHRLYELLLQLSLVVTQVLGEGDISKFVINTMELVKHGVPFHSSLYFSQ